MIYDRKPWEQRMRHAIGSVKLPKQIAEDFIDCFNEIDWLRKEIDRLKSGRFTEEEFQNLCHTFSEDDECRFKKGCEEYQRKLFGDKNEGCER